MKEYKSSKKKITNSLVDYERLEKSHDPVVVSMEYLYENLEDICSECGLSDKCPARVEPSTGNYDLEMPEYLDKSKCPAVLAMLDGVNGRILDTKNIGPWIGIGLDGVLSKTLDDEFWDDSKIGEPVESIVELAKSLIGNSVKIKIFTSRVNSSNPMRRVAERAIREWTRRHIGMALPSTSEIDHLCLDMFLADCHQVIPDKGKILEFVHRQNIALTAEALVKLGILPKPDEDLDIEAE